MEKLNRLINYINTHSSPKNDNSAIIYLQVIHMYSQAYMTDYNSQAPKINKERKKP